MVHTNNNFKETLNALREEITSSNSHLMVAVDIAKLNNCACFRVSDGKTLCKKFNFRNDIGGFNTLINQLHYYLKKGDYQKVIFALEPSGYYWEHLYQYLSLKKETVVLVSPLAVNRNRETINVSKDKSDPKDAYNIADLVMQGKFYLPIQRTKGVAQLRRFVKIYYRLMKNKAVFRNLLRNAVGSVFPELERYFKDIEAVTTLVILEKYPVPSMITTVKKSRFISYVKKRNPHFSHKRINEIYELAKTSVGIKGEDESIIYEIQWLLKELKDINLKIAELNQKTDALVKDREDYRLLLSLKGIGPIIAISLIAEIGDIANFHSGKQLIKLAGLDLWAEESGTSIHTLKHITKRGRKLLRLIVYQAALGAIRVEGTIRQKYLQLLNNQPQKKKMKSKAVVAIGCKLLRIIFRMLTDKIEYSETYEQGLKEKYLKKAA
jgi:transposase